MVSAYLFTLWVCLLPITLRSYVLPSLLDSTRNPLVTNPIWSVALGRGTDNAVYRTYLQDDKRYSRRLIDSKLFGVYDPGKYPTDVDQISILKRIGNTFSRISSFSLKLISLPTSHLCNLIGAESYTNVHSTSYGSSSRQYQLYLPRSGNRFHGNSKILYAANLTISREQEELLRKLGEPLLDIEKVKRVIREWTAPLPQSYLVEPLVIAGPSAVGKNRLIRALLKDYSRFFHKVVTHTTRQPRPDEVNGTNYHYISREEFEDRIKNDQFIEWSFVHDNMYGVSINAWQSAQQQGKISILEIDIQGAKKVKQEAAKHGIKPHFLFIAPPHIDTLRERLVKRGTESSEQIELRLKNAYVELEQCEKENIFDKVIVNDDLELARNAMFRIVREWYPTLPSASRIRMMQRRLKNIRSVLKGEKSTAEISMTGEIRGVE